MKEGMQLTVTAVTGYELHMTGNRCMAAVGLSGAASKA